MVVWEDGKMNKSAYRKFKVMTVLGVDDFASMREVVTRRYKRILENSKVNIPSESVDDSDLKGHDTSGTGILGAPSMTAVPSSAWVGNREPSSALKGRASQSFRRKARSVRARL